MMYERIVQLRNHDINVYRTRDKYNIYFSRDFILLFLFISHLSEFNSLVLSTEKYKKKKKVTVGAELLNHDEICWNIFIKSFH